MSTDSIIEKIVIARVGLLLKHPFFGNMGTRLKIQEAKDWCTTAATDGRHLYFNREFFESLSTKEIEFVVCHEILHNVFDHFGRVEGRDRNIFNVAADYCVNGQLIRDRIGESPKKIKIFHDSKYYGMSAEEVYDKIYDEMDEQELAALGQLLDQHIDWTKDDGTGRPRYTKDQLKEIRDELREAAIQAAQSAGAGNVPASIERMIKDLTEPKMNWRELLRQQIQSVIKNDYTFMRPNRKGWHMPAILPGTNYSETIDICVCLDLSGSISDNQARDFLSEIKGIMQEYQDFKIKLWTFDTQVYNEQDFTAYNIDEFEQYELIGGGGTLFKCNWDYMQEHDITPKKLIMFTDMGTWGDDWGDPEYCDTIFIAHDTDVIAPHGITVKYSSN